jgi:hypothetical protein
VVIEHTFVTTMDSPQAIRAAMSFLGERGFTSAQNPAFPVAPTPSQMDTLHMRRGRANPNRAKSVAELPQTLRLDFDRGRVTVAASITPSHAWGGSRWTSVGAAGERADRMVMHQKLLTSIVIGLELLLAQREHPVTASREWQLAEAHIVDEARRRRRRNAITLIVFVAVVTLLVALLILSASR